ncbi:MAG: hypothetical protein AAF969_01265, partial [Bacteroidota bacterium]
MKHIFVLATLLLAFACNTEQVTITNPEDYQVYLEASPTRNTSKYFELWNSKITKDSTQLLSFPIVAGEYNRYFKNTGDITYLKKAEKALKKAVEIAAINKSSYYRSLARNYISQHRFKEALAYADSARTMGSGVKDSQSLLFDVHMELGNYAQAQKYLDSIKNFSDFGYLIRASKWNDYKGDLNTTIALMEQAIKKAEDSNNKSLKIWSYSNIADYYGHAGRLNDSYKYCLKTLEQDPNNAYAKKGIAWIIYSHEKNAIEAMRILNTVDKQFKSPDHYLLKAEIAEFKGDDYNRARNLDAYYKLVQNPDYGTMYNIPNIDVYLSTSTNFKKALRLAQEEVGNRATPENYSVLAYA